MSTLFIGRQSVRRKYVRRKNVRRKNVPVPHIVYQGTSLANFKKNVNNKLRL